MGIEDDLFNTLKYANLGGKSDPLKMMRTMLHNLEVVMLKKMDAQIRARITVLKDANSKDDDEGLDPFTILGVKMDATKEEVTQAYREKAEKAHPDKGGTHEEMVKVNAAYEAIMMFKGWKK